MSMVGRKKKELDDLNEHPHRQDWNQEIVVQRCQLTLFECGWKVWWWEILSVGGGWDEVPWACSWTTTCQKLRCFAFYEKGKCGEGGEEGWYHAVGCLHFGLGFSKNWQSIATTFSVKNERKVSSVRLAAGPPKLQTFSTTFGQDFKPKVQKQHLWKSILTILQHQIKEHCSCPVKPHCCFLTTD